MLDAIRDGSYAREWLAEDASGRPWFNARRLEERQHRIEQVGERLRAMMPFLRPVPARDPVGA
jgi:ketol-acid reductoisomerase